MSIDSNIFRNVLGRFATGVTVVTGYFDGGLPVGVTVNAFSSLSLDPPLVLFCLDRSTGSLDAFVNGNGFALNMLGKNQQHLSDIFASRKEDRFSGIDYETWNSGAPILSGCLANLECSLEAVHEGGDHLIIVGRVEKLMQADEGRPLLYYQGRYAHIDKLD
ncbi:MAG: flavin reductase family protein [Rhodospirillaceae bacterium]|nr:flavin reductase family protein [Rhodospirillaceae bacterium]